MKKIRAFVLAGITLVILAIVIIITITNKKYDSGEFKSHKAVTRTERVGGLIAYNIRSDDILEIPEEYFTSLDKNMTYDELVAEIGEPSGTVGSGIVRDYWRIGENKYATVAVLGGCLLIEIWSGN